MPRRLMALSLALGAAAWPFAGPLFAGRVLYFRDVGVTYYPDLVFLSRSLAQGVWPLWHPGADAGAPFLAAYPVHLLLAWVAGARGTLALSPPLHVLVAIGGAALLARRLGTSAPASMVCGLVFGLSGLMLGSVLYPVFLAAAWAPLAVALLLSLDAPRPWSRAAALGCVLALQVSTLGVEVLPQTALAALVLRPRRPGTRARRALAVALVVALLLCAPVVAGSLDLLAGGARGRGFSPDVAMSYSAPPPVLAEALLPRFLGDPHTFSDVGFWGQPFFGGGTPFFLSLYLGPVVLLLAACAGARERRLWLLAALGVLLALGSAGPAGPAMALLMGPMRAPVKFFLLTTLAVALLCGRGLDRVVGDRAPRAFVVPGVVLLVAALAVARWPGLVTGALLPLVPAAAPALVADVVARTWPAELLATGAAAIGAGLAVALGGRAAWLAAVLAVLDLLRVNAPLNPAAPASFYDLRPPMRAVVEEARSAGRYRWFACGIACAGPLSWREPVVRTGSDAWLYAVDRQALVPRTHVLDGLEGAFDVDRMGLAPEGSTLTLGEMQPGQLEGALARLRLANVRWILGFDPQPDGRLRARRSIPLPEVAEPLRLYELADPLPRAFFVPGSDREPSASAARARAVADGFDPRRVVLLDAAPPVDPASDDGGAAVAAPVAGASVDYELIDPHTVRLTADTPPGYLVVLDGHHVGWTAADEKGTAVPVLRAYGRYRAIPTGGGAHVITLRYVPRWRFAGLAAAAAGLLAAAALAAGGSVSEFTASRGMRRANLPSGTQE